MKTLKFLILIVSMIGLFSCNKDETEEINNIDVEKYIELLKANKYESGVLPNFTSQEIPTLLMYINDNSVVNRFPYYTISSYAPINPSYRLGVLIIWTIESIRVSSNNKQLFLVFPSQHPFIQTNDNPVKWIEDHDDEAYEIVRQAYSDWWRENESKEFNDFKNIDPLRNTNYSWH